MSRFTGKQKGIALGVLAVVGAALIVPAASAEPATDPCTQVRDQVAANERVFDAAQRGGGLTSAERTRLKELRDIDAAALRGCATAPSPSPSSSGTPAPTGTPTTTGGPSPTATASPSPTPTPTGTPAAWPGPTNTGVPASTTLTAYTGPCTITTPDTVIDAKTVNCDLIIRTTGVKFTRSRINGTVSTEEGSAYSFTISDSTIVASTPATPRIVTGIGNDHFTATRVDVAGGNRGIHCRRHCEVRDSWVHGTVVTSDWHASGIRASEYSTIVHNTIACDFGPPTAQDGGCSADLTMYGDFEPVGPVLVQGNRFVANPDSAFCAYGGSSGAGPTPAKPYANDTHDVRFVDNVFERGPNRNCAAYGPIDSFDPSRPGNVWSGNVWDSGEPVTP